MMFQFSKPLQRKIDLLYLLTQKEVALKYKRTMLGIFWSLLNPLLMALVFFVAFKIFMRFNVENYSFFLLAALFPWTWFSSSILISGRTLIDNVSLIKKVIFPRQYLVVSVILAQLINLLFSIPILLFFSCKDGGGPNLSWVIGIPLMLVIQMILTFGLALIVAIANTYFRDTEYLVGVMMNLLFWMTPITYPLASIPEKYHQLFLLNPLTSLMFSWREMFINNHILWKHLGIAFLLACALLLIGQLVFRKLERRLDEVL